MGISSNPPSTKPDLFSALQQPGIPSPSASGPKPSPLRPDEPAATASPSYALPTNLPSALRHLDDEQLDRLLAAVLAERQARGSKKLSVSDEPRGKKRTKEVAQPLAQGKLNAVRAAFKAGVKQSRIAREFGISQSDVRKALANDEK
jgi:DNA invertase Pin-like site-specific DNA recombinase